jgi:arginyl-tRNA synthetase
MTADELRQAEQALAYGCIKYSDLSSSREKDYVFSFDRVSVRTRACT